MKESTWDEELESIRTYPLLSHSQSLMGWTAAVLYHIFVELAGGDEVVVETFLSIIVLDLLSYWTTLQAEFLIRSDIQAACNGRITVRGT